ncbi:hypothetical protein [Cystobacter ferrugineus]|uniref:hypothetical protein n=1 Tax=Cystobacter ferrugineus TaxID=83449 RepID=UPI00116111DE|nr:hypothetical protein [Cystobacter ferrugineus]
MALLLPTEEVAADALAAFKPNRCTVAAASHFRLGGAVMPTMLAQLIAVLLGITPQAGCVHRRVEGLIQPAHFEFVTITPQRKRGPGGWRAACVHARINHGNSGESYTCQFGVEMPIENAENGPIPNEDAQEKAAECANNAAYAVLLSITEPTPPPLYTLCSAIRNKYRETLNDAIKGSRVLPTCDPKTKPVVFGIDAPF